jgi:integrase
MGVLMANLRLSLNDKVIGQLPAPDDGQYVVRDADLNGFYLLVGKKRRTYMVHGDLKRPGERATSIKVSVGDAADLTATKARMIAKGYLSEMGQGRHPKPPVLQAAPEVVAANTAVAVTAADSGITLRAAWDRYHIALIRKKRSDGTIAGYKDHVERVFKAWLDTPLRELGDDPARVARKHDEITQASGPYIANGSMRTLRAIYNHARKTNRELPSDNPVDGVDWNNEERRDTGMGASDLPSWFAQLATFDNPIRREFHLLTLLSGCRPTALKQSRLEHLDLRRRVLHIPNPKGGAKRAFDIPLSRQMISCLLRVIRFGRFLHPFQAQAWLFPAESASGHMAEGKEDRGELSKWGNDLRQSYRTLAAIARVSEVDAKLLMNHAIPGVNSGYITRHKLLEDHLRSQQQAISDVIFKPIRADVAKPGAVQAWLGPHATRKAIEEAGAQGTHRARPEELDAKSLAA